MTRLVSVLIALALIGSVLRAQPTPEQQARIDALIRQLGDADGTVRKEASRKLEEIGWLALSALEEAMKSDDPEVRVRATEIHEKLVSPTPEQLQQLRDEVQENFSRGDYLRMIEGASRLLVAKTAETSDRVWLGHACQLAGRWKEAVEAYLEVLRQIDAELKVGPKPVSAPALPPGFDDFGPGRGIGRPVAPRVVPPDPNWRPKRIKQRTYLALWVARMQRVELKDTKAAVKTLTDALVHLDIDKGKVQRYWFKVLQELAGAQEDAEDVRAALSTWQKLHLACLVDQYGRHAGGFLDMQAVERLLGRLDEKEAAPELSFVHFLSPARPEVHLAPDADDTRKRSYFPSGNPNSAHWKYAFSPPPGMEFDKLAFACDIEQLKARHGGHFRCFVMVPRAGPRTLDLGDIRWTGEEPTGREVFRATFDIPPGVRLVHINTGTWKDCFNVHRVDVKATFRPATEKPEPLAPRVGAWMQTEFIPDGGKGSCGEKELRSQRAYGDVKPGKYRLRYEVPGRDDVFDQAFLIEPGRRYGIFVNLDSPFKWSQAGPGRMGHHPKAGLSLAPLPGGGYLAAWGVMKKRIMLCTTKDLTTWSEPEVAPFNSVFHNMTPTIYAAKDGTIWLAYFSTRLSLLDRARPQFRLWLTSTRDGKSWTPPRPVDVGESRNMPEGPPQMLEGPDGRCWIFWRRHAGSARSFGDVRELAPVTLTSVPEGAGPTQTSVAVDARGVFHMVFASYEHGFGYTTSKDGVDWSDVKFPVKRSRKYTLGHPQLILRDGKMLLLYSHHGTWLLPMRPGGEPVDSGSGLKITGHVVPLYGSRPFITKDGEVLLLAGADTSWLLRARLSDLLKLCDGK